LRRDRAPPNEPELVVVGFVAEGRRVIRPAPAEIGNRGGGFVEPVKRRRDERAAGGGGVRDEPDDRDAGEEAEDAQRAPLARPRPAGPATGARLFLESAPASDAAAATSHAARPPATKRYTDRREPATMKPPTTSLFG